MSFLQVIVINNNNKALYSIHLSYGEEEEKKKVLVIHDLENRSINEIDKKCLQKKIEKISRHFHFSISPYHKLDNNLHVRLKYHLMVQDELELMNYLVIPVILVHNKILQEMDQVFLDFSKKRNFYRLEFFVHIYSSNCFISRIRWFLSTC
jgi:hypothetical protein